MLKRIFFISLLTFFIFSFHLHSHGIDHVTVAGGTGIEAHYENGNPVAGVEVKIFSPTDKKNPFQQGFSDRNGRFMFKADTPGDWTVIFNDGTGHGIKSEIHIDDSLKTITKPVQRKHFPLLFKIITGISVLFGLTGLLFFLSTKKNDRK